MKKTISSFAAILLAALFLFNLAGCSQKVEATGVWETATYLKNTELGKGDKTITVDVIAEDKTITFTIHTNQKFLGDALTEHELIDGEEGQFGLYIKTVNGILADYDVDQTYWAINKNGEATSTGADAVSILDGDHYEIVRTTM